MKEADLFLKALELSPAEREVVFAYACGEDADLKAKVEALLHEHDHGEGLLDESPESIHASLLRTEEELAHGHAH